MNAERTQPNPEVASSLGRRELLIGAASLAALAACGGGGGAEAAGSSSTRASRPLGPTTTLHTARLVDDPFTLGVASGDPAADSVLLWTRLAPTPLVGGAGGMGDDRVDVIWEVAHDARFADVAAQGVATAEPEHGHSLHVDAGGLDPATDYHYRFTVGDHTSPTGRTRTLPAPDQAATRFALAVANCQWLDTGRYGAYRHMVEEDLDLVLHLGDYIYEFPGERAVPARIPVSLDDFRLRYAAYRSDPDLRAAHARFPFVCTWDDHEVANNYMGDTLPSGASAAEVRDLKAAAYKAWWENLPVRVEAPDGPDLPVFQHLDVGDLLRLYVLDERQEADPPPCREPGDAAAGALDEGDCAARTDVDRTRLGADQEAWFADATSSSQARWNVVGNPVVLAGIDAGTTEADYYLDTWDGFPQARERLIAQIGATENPVVLTGDYHAGMVLDVRERPFDAGSAVVCTELMAPPISSPLFDQDISGRTPQLRQQINAHGYLAVEVTPDALTARFEVLDDVLDAASPRSTAATWRVVPGTPRASEV